MEFENNLRTLDAVLLLQDRLDELFEAEEIPEKTYNRKRSFRQLLRAVNKADRMICSVRKQVQPVALFIPKDVHILPLAQHDVFAGQQIESIVKSTLMEKHPAGIQTFIDDQPWVEIAGIESEYATVYKEHPTHTITPTRQIKRVNLTSSELEGFYGGHTDLGYDGAENNRFERRYGAAFSYDTEQRILRLSRPFGTNVFLVFEARLRPGKIDVRKYDCADVPAAEDTALKNATVSTPGHFEDALITTALSKLLPVQADMVTNNDITAMTAGQEDANGPSFISPGRMYSCFGEW